MWVLFIIYPFFYFCSLLSGSSLLTFFHSDFSPSTIDSPDETGLTINTNPTGVISTTHERGEMAEKSPSTSDFPVGPVVGAIVAFAVLAVMIFVAMRSRSSQKHLRNCRDVTVSESSAQLADKSKGKFLVVRCSVYLSQVEIFKKNLYPPPPSTIAVYLKTIVHSCVNCVCKLLARIPFVCLRHSSLRWHFATVVYLK